jgi:hypothetical protein
MQMSGYFHPDIELELEKSKRREFYQEVERVALVKEALRDQPGRLSTALNHLVSLFRRVGAGRAPHAEATGGARRAAPLQKHSKTDFRLPTKTIKETRA